MKRLIPLIGLLLVGCSSKTPEEVEAEKFPQPKMMTEAEGAAFMAGQNDPRHGGAVPSRPPAEGSQSQK